MTRHNRRDLKIATFVRSWLPVHDDRLTRYFTLACFSTPAIAGSVSSLILNSGAVGGLLEVGCGNVRLSRDRRMIHLTIPLYCYCAAYLASFVINPLTPGSWHYLLPIVTFLLFPFLYSSWCMSTKRTVARSAITASAVACYGALILAAVQFHFYGMRAEGGAGNAIVFATVTCLATSVALAGLLSRDRVANAPLFGAVVAGCIALLYSGSRTTWVAFLVAAVVVLWVYRGKMHARMSAWALSFGILAIGALIIVGFETIPSRVSALATDWRQLSIAGDYDSSLGRRAGLWQIGLAAAVDSPIMGHGPQLTKELIRDGFWHEIGLQVDYGHFHNGFLNTWVETGLLGVISLVGVFATATWIAVRTLAASRDPDERLGAVVLIIMVTTYMIGGLAGILVGHDILDSALMMFLVVGTYLASGTSSLDDRAIAGSAAQSSNNGSH